MGSDVFLILSHYLALPCLTIISILGFRAVVLGEGGGGIVLLLNFEFPLPDRDTCSLAGMLCIAFEV